jgi:hypothetical protein
MYPQKNRLGTVHCKRDFRNMGEILVIPPPIVQAGGAPFPSRLWLVLLVSTPYSMLSNASQESSYGDTLSDIACVETSMMFGTGYGA